MFALFSPSEGKSSGGTGAFEDVREKLPGGWEIRSGFAEVYEQILQEGSEEQKKKLTGWIDVSKIDALPSALRSAPVRMALERYTGVGYQYLDVATLSDPQRVFLSEQVLIFSNLLGPVRGGDLIPEYKAKTLPLHSGAAIARHYRQHTSRMLDKIIDPDPVLDLRAGAFKGFYEPKGEVIEYRFLKEGKSVNHWSKAYRGLVLRAFAQNRPSSVQEMIELEIPGLNRVDVQAGGNKTLITCEAQ